MTNSSTKAREAERPWMVYKQKNGTRDRIMEPGWPGELDSSELSRLQEALIADPDLARVWGWRPTMKRRATAAIERVAYWGSPDDIALNRKLVREFSRRPQEGKESPSVCVKKSTPPAPPHWGRRKVESWESEMLRLSVAGVGVRKIAKTLKAQYGVAISGPTVSAQLRELRGQLMMPLGS
jgi:hypothetical protein